VVIHYEEALYQVYGPLPFTLPYLILLYGEGVLPPSAEASGFISLKCYQQQ